MCVEYVLRSQRTQISPPCRMSLEGGGRLHLHCSRCHGATPLEPSNIAHGTFPPKPFPGLSLGRQRGPVHSFLLGSQQSGGLAGRICATRKPIEGYWQGKGPVGDGFPPAYLWGYRTHWQVGRLKRACASKSLSPPDKTHQEGDQYIW